MLYHTHLVFGVLLALVFYPYLGSPWLAVPVMVLGSIIADIDCPTSKVGKSVLFRPMQWCVKHRGFFHSFLAAILFSLAVYGWSSNLGKSFFIGYLGHLFLDAMTKEGVPILWPLDIKAAGSVRSGGVGEALFLAAIVFLICVICIAKFF